MLPVYDFGYSTFFIQMGAHRIFFCKFHLASVSRFIRIITQINLSFIFRMNNIPLWVFKTHFVYFFHLPIYIRLASTFWLLWVALLWTKYINIFFKPLLSITVYIEEMGLLDPVMLFSIVVAPFYISTNTAQISVFLHTLSNTSFLVFVLTISFLMHVKCYLIGIPLFFI